MTTPRRIASSLRESLAAHRRHSAGSHEPPVPPLDDALGAPSATVHQHDEWPELGFEDLIGTTSFDVHERAHIVVDGAVCTDCSTRDCVVACPAKLFVPTADGGILFNYEQCFECGTCYLVCNREGAISWTYPEGGHGVVFRRS